MANIATRPRAGSSLQRPHGDDAVGVHVAVLVLDRHVLADGEAFVAQPVAALIVIIAAIIVVEIPCPAGSTRQTPDLVVLALTEAMNTALVLMHSPNLRTEPRIVVERRNYVVPRGIASAGMTRLTRKLKSYLMEFPGKR